MRRLTFPARGLEFVSPFTDGGKSYDMRFSFNLRLGDWRITVVDRDTGETLAADRRVSPGCRLFATPNGVLFADGPDPYKQTDLAAGVLAAIYATNAEVAEARAEAAINPERMRLA